MKVFNMFITAGCVIFLIKLRWPKTKSLYNNNNNNNNNNSDDDDDDNDADGDDDDDDK